MDRMRLERETIKKIAQGFTFKLQTLSLNHNKLTGEGVKCMKEQF